MPSRRNATVATTNHKSANISAMGWLSWVRNCGDGHHDALSAHDGPVVLPVHEGRRMIISLGPRLKNPHFGSTRHVA